MQPRMDWDEFPSAPKRTSIHYGWIILVLGGIGTFCSAPGQTIGLAAFTDPLIDALGIPRVDLSLAYMVGTLMSSLLLTRAGRLYDQFGARVVGPLAAVALGAVLLVLSVCDRIAGAVGSALSIDGALAATAVMIVGFFLLRFSGQGVLTLVCRNMVMKWFQQRRGLANAVLGSFLVVGFSLTPPLFNSMIRLWGFAWSWRLIALAVGGGFALLAAAAFRDNPEACGLSPDAGLRPRTETGLYRIHRDFCLTEAKRDYTFWAFCLPVAMGGLFVTAFSFHVASFFQSAGMDEAQAFGIFLPISIVSVAVSFLGGWLADRVRLKWLLMAFTLTLGGSMLTSAFLAAGATLWCLVGMLGIFQGLFGLLMTVTWPKFYGRTHLGAISGLQMSFTVAASAVGPWLFSLSLDVLGSYRVASLFCAGLMAVFFIGSFFADNPQERIGPGQDHGPDPAG